MRSGAASILFSYPRCAIFVVAILFSPSSYASDFSISQVQASIKNRLVNQSAGGAAVGGQELISGMEMMPLAYRSRAYMPFWIDARHRLQTANALIEAIGRAGDDGLLPADYHLAAIYRLLSHIVHQRSSANKLSSEHLADLDLILTDAFLSLGTHLLTGKVNPDTRKAQWKVDPGREALLPLLIKAAATGDVTAALDALRPSHAGYRALRDTLGQLHKIAANDGWPRLDDQLALRPGDRGSGVAALRHRLSASGDLVEPVKRGDSHRFDASLAEAVKRFQRRHGLDVDGIVGPKTISMLNISVEKRIRQAEINLERWRWLPHQLESRYIMVNTAAFTLSAVASGQVTLTMRVAVGRPARRSPVFSSKVSYLVVNPYWIVPRLIAVEDILPAVQADIHYLSERGIRVYPPTWPAGATPIDPATVDWKTYNKDRFPFIFRQDPGPHNALGYVKFMFPNTFDVYLHGTPDNTIFKKSQRDISSGCIRLEDPLALADFVLSGDARWPSQTLREQVESGQTLKIQLEHPLPVYILYMTAWADDQGAVQFCNDIYGQDAPLDRALNQKRPLVESEIRNGLLEKKRGGIGGLRVAYPFQVLTSPVSR